VVPRGGLPLLQHLGFREERVTVEDGCVVTDPVVAEVRGGVRALTSMTLIPTAKAMTKVPSTRRSPNSVSAAYASLKCIGLRFIERFVNQTLSVSVTVRPYGCLYTSPTSKSS